MIHHCIFYFPIALWVLSSLLNSKKDKLLLPFPCPLPQEGIGFLTPTTLPSCWQISDFDFGKVLGRGSFGMWWELDFIGLGRVYLAKERRSGYIVSIKCIRKEFIVKQHMEEQLKREIIIQSSLKYFFPIRVILVHIGIRISFPFMDTSPIRNMWWLFSSTVLIVCSDFDFHI